MGLPLRRLRRLHRAVHSLRPEVPARPGGGGSGSGPRSRGERHAEHAAEPSGRSVHDRSLVGRRVRRRAVCGRRHIPRADIRNDRDGLQRIRHVAGARCRDTAPVRIQEDNGHDDDPRGHRSDVSLQRMHADAEDPGDPPADGEADCICGRWVPSARWG